MVVVVVLASSNRSSAFMMTDRGCRISGCDSNDGVSDEINVSIFGVVVVVGMVLFMMTDKRFIIAGCGGDQSGHIFCGTGNNIKSIFVVGVMVRWC